MAQIKRIGFGQVEPNHLSGIVDGSIYAQLPVDTAKMGTIIENGRFAKYNMAAEVVTTEGELPWLMIYNEVKLYDERYQGLKDFAMIDKNYTDGEIVPRLIEINVGDIFTTNTFGANTSNTAEVEGVTIPDDIKTSPVYVYVGEDGYLTLTETEGPKFQVVKVYTMPDGLQPGVKLQRIA